MTTSIRIDRPLPEGLVRTLKAVERVLQAQGASYFVCGALARDIQLQHVHGQVVERATEDIDCGVSVSSWERFDDVLKGAERSQGVRLSPLIRHRLLLLDQPTAREVSLDLVPFGGVERADASLAWPPDGDVVMNVAGFAEAADNAFAVEVEPGFQIRVASLPALAVLKLVAWKERHTYNHKDAVDLGILIRRNGAILDLTTLYEDEARLLEEQDYDLDLVGAALLGREARSLCLPLTEAILREILTDKRYFRVLLDEMLRHSGSRDDESQAGRFEALVKAFRSGFLGP